MTTTNDSAVRRTLEDAGVELIDENGGGPGVRLRARQGKKPSRIPGQWLEFIDGNGGGPKLRRRNRHSRIFVARFTLRK